jgi:hypothetical protein
MWWLQSSPVLHAISHGGCTDVLGLPERKGVLHLTLYGAVLGISGDWPLETCQFRIAVVPNATTFYQLYWIFVAEHSLHTSSRTCFFIPEQALHFLLWRYRDSACDVLPVLQWHPDHWNDKYLHSGASCTAVPCIVSSRKLGTFRYSVLISALLYFVRFSK